MICLQGTLKSSNTVLEIQRATHVQNVCAQGDQRRLASFPLTDFYSLGKQKVKSMHCSFELPIEALELCPDTHTEPLGKGCRIWIRAFKETCLIIS